MKVLGTSHIHISNHLDVRSAHSRDGRLQGLALLCLLAGMLLALLPSPSHAQSANPIAIITIEGTITQVTKSYVERGFSDAKADGAPAILIDLDSAGGNANAADAIVERITQSTIPVIVYVGPGDSARGAAVMILAAAHVTAMAPDATIGDASRVAQGGDSATSDQETMADLTSLAEGRGRSTTWVDRALENNLRLTADEAKAAGLIDEIAPDRASLLAMLDGRTVTLVDGQTAPLTTSDTTRTIDMTTWERILAFIASPSVAYVLLCFGVLGIFLELASPGGFVAGSIGLICLAIGIYAFSQLPIEWNGFALMLVAFILLGIDLFVTSFGVLTIAGLGSFIWGSYILIDTDIVGYDPISRPLIWTATACVVAFAIFVGVTGLRTLGKKPVTGVQTMIGETGIVREQLDPRGMIFVHGELWQAQVLDLTPGDVVAIGSRVEIRAINGLLLDVRPIADLPVSTDPPRNTPRGSSVLPVSGGVEGMQS